MDVEASNALKRGLFTHVILDACASGSTQDCTQLYVEMHSMKRSLALEQTQSQVTKFN